MFNPDPTSKRMKLAIRFFTYGVMSMSVVIISSLVIFYTLGYRLDKNLTFSQGGLVGLKSFPDGAAIAVDGLVRSVRTPANVNLTTGTHTVTLSRDGYHTWDKGIDLAPGQLLWLNYVRLIPKTIVTATVQDLEHLAGTLASPDRRWILVQPQADIPKFMVLDIADEYAPKLTPFTLPEAVVAKAGGAYGTLTMVEWDAQSQAVLLRYKVKDKTEFIVVDRSKPAEAVNLSTLFGFAIEEAHFGPDRNIIFANTGGVLRRLDVGGKSASGALVASLKQFRVNKSGVVAFVSEEAPENATAPGQTQLVGLWHQDTIKRARTVKAGEQLRLAYGEYDNHRYLAYATSTGAVTIIRDPATSSATDSNAVFASFELGGLPDWLEFNSNGRMLAGAHQEHFASFDIEEAKAYREILPFNLTEAPARPQWLDDFYIGSAAGGTLRLLEFDGTNVRQITGAEPAYPAILSPSGKRLFSATKNQLTGLYALQGSQLVVE